MSEAQDLVDRVDAAAAAVDGVAHVYSAGPVIVDLVKNALPVTRGLSVVRDGDPLDVVVSIGVDAAGRSSEVAQRVIDAIRDEVGGNTVVHVRVSRMIALPRPPEAPAS